MYILPSQKSEPMTDALIRLLSTLCIAMTISSPPALGAPLDAPRGEEERERAGPYLGVLPGVNERAPNKPRRSRRPMITWVGFQMRPDGGCRVFVQGTQAITYEFSQRGELNLQLRFPDVRFHSRIERLPLDTSYFPAVVQSVRARRQRRDALVNIQLREPARHRVRQQGTFTFIDFPAPLVPVESGEADEGRARPQEREP